MMDDTLRRSRPGGWRLHILVLLSALGLGSAQQGSKLTLQSHLRVQAQQGRSPAAWIAVVQTTDRPASPPAAAFDTWLTVSSSSELPASVQLFSSGVLVARQAYDKDSIQRGAARQSISVPEECLYLHCSLEISLQNASGMLYSATLHVSPNLAEADGQNLQQQPALSSQRRKLSQQTDGDSSAAGPADSDFELSNAFSSPPPTVNSPPNGPDTPVLQSPPPAPRAHASPPPQPASPALSPPSSTIPPISDIARPPVGNSNPPTPPLVAPLPPAAHPLAAPLTPGLAPAPMPVFAPGPDIFAPGPDLLAPGASLLAPGPSPLELTPTLVPASEATVRGTPAGTPVIAPVLQPTLGGPSSSIAIPSPSQTSAIALAPALALTAATGMAIPAPAPQAQALPPALGMSAPAPAPTLSAALSMSISAPQPIAPTASFGDAFPDFAPSHGSTAVGSTAAPLPGTASLQPAFALQPFGSAGLPFTPISAPHGFAPGLSAPVGAPGPASVLPFFLTQAPSLSPAADRPDGPVPVLQAAFTPAPQPVLSPDQAAALSSGQQAAFAPAPEPVLSPDQASALSPVGPPEFGPAAFAPAAFVPVPEGLFPVAEPALAAAETPLAELYSPIEAPFSGLPVGAEVPVSELAPTAETPGSSVPLIVLPPAAPGQEASALSVAPQSVSAFSLINPVTGLAERATAEILAASPSTNLITANSNFILRLQLESSGNINLSPQAINVNGGTVQSITAVAGSNGRLFDVAIARARSARFITVSTAAGLSLASGLALAQSNSITIEVDDDAPQTKVTNSQRYQTASNASPSFLVDFGKRVAQLDPIRLFSITGTDRTDVAYDVNDGRIFITAYVPDQTLRTTITVSVAAGVTTDLVGHPNSAASATYTFTPTSPRYATTSKTVNGVFGGVLAAVAGSSAVASVASAGGLISGTPAATFQALHLVSFGQVFYMMSNMAVPNLPANFRQVSSSFGWTVLDIRMPWENTPDRSKVNPDAASSGFPYPPVGVTSSGFGPGNVGDGEYFDVTQSGASSGRTSPTDTQSTGNLANSGLTNAGRRLSRRMLAMDEDEEDWSVGYSIGRGLLQDSEDNSTVQVPGIAGDQRLVVTSTGLSNQTSIIGQDAQDRLDDVTTMALGDEDHPWQRFFRTLFWLGVIMGGATLLQYLVLLWFAHQRWTPPVMAIFPRPQLFLVLMGLPSLVQAASVLLQGGGGQLAGGIVIVVMLPIIFFAWAVYFIVSYLHTSVSRRAAYILEDDPVVLMREEQEHGQKKWSPWRAVERVLLGPRMVEGAWRPLKRPDSRFVGRWGPLFEENRGPPMVMRGVSYEADPHTGLCHRGTLEPHLGRPFLRLGGRAWYRHELQACASALLIFKTLGFGILLNAYTTDRAWSQVIVLLAISALYVVYLRFVRPTCERFELGVAIIGGLLEVGTFVCGVILLANPDASNDVTLRIGLAMLILQGISFALFLLSTFLLVKGVATSLPAVRKWRPTPSDKFAAVVHQVMLQDPHILARKYADRWLVRSLGMGLFKRPLHRREDPLRRPTFMRQLTLNRPSRQGVGRGSRMTMTPRVVSSNPFQRIEEEPPAPPRRLPSLKSPWPAILTGDSGGATDRVSREEDDASLQDVVHASDHVSPRSPSGQAARNRKLLAGFSSSADTR